MGAINKEEPGFMKPLYAKYIYWSFWEHARNQMCIITSYDKRDATTSSYYKDITCEMLKFVAHSISCPLNIKEGYYFSMP